MSNQVGDNFKFLWPSQKSLILSRKEFATNFVWDVWFDSQIVCFKIEHLSNIDEMAKMK